LVKVKKTLFSSIAFLGTVLAAIVVILGAYTRLKDAGLGCPDWPGCYGHFIVPGTKMAIASAQQLYPNQPVDSLKAWAEMIHRYFAGSLVLLVAILAIARQHIQREKILLPSKIPFFLVGCILFQAMLGMWTVTLQLLPLVVMGHLLGGMTIAALLWWLTLDTGQYVCLPHPNSLNDLKPWVIMGIIIVVIQLFLGGWTSANYASMSCPTFPFCEDQLFPKFDFVQAFNFFSPIGQNYQGGILGNTARITIQMTHRYWAFITFIYILFLGCYILFSSKTFALKNTMGMILIFLLSQLFLGILNITTQLYLPIAIMHNAVALLLFLSMLTLAFQLSAASKKVNKMMPATVNTSSSYGVIS
jgi:heme a synthase